MKFDLFYVSPGHDDTIIEINTIEELLKLAEDTGEDLIIARGVDDTLPSITVYDYYIE